MTKFRITGTVGRKPFATDKFAKFSICSAANGRRAFFDVKAFAADMIDEIKTLGEGEEIMVEGELMSEQLKDKTEPVKIGGRDAWVTALKATKILDGKGNQRTAPPAREPGADDDVPFV